MIRAFGHGSNSLVIVVMLLYSVIGRDFCTVSFFEKLPGRLDRQRVSYGNAQLCKVLVFHTAIIYL